MMPPLQISNFELRIRVSLDRWWRDLLGLIRNPSLKGLPIHSSPCGAQSAIRNAKGFTLIELMIALVLLSVVTSMTYGIVGMGMRAWRSGSLEFLWALDGQRALRQLTRDVQNIMTPYQMPPTMAQKGNLVKLIGERDHLECFVLDPSPGQGMSALTEVRYRVAEKSLIRQWFAQFAPTTEQTSAVEDVCSDVVGLNVEFQSSTGEWVNEWTTPRRLPRAVRLRLEREARRSGRQSDGSPNVQRQILTALVPLT